MTKKFKSLLTDKGKALIADAIAGGKTISLKYFAVGDGNGSEVTPSAAQTALVNEVARIELNSVKETDANGRTVAAEAIIPADKGGFWIREAGIFTADGVLVAVSQMPVTYKPDTDDGATSTQTMRMLLAVSDASAISLTVDDSLIIATEAFVNEAIDTHAKSRNHPDASTTDKGFVQLSSETNSSDEKKAATPKAVKAANDNADKRLEKEKNLSDVSDKAKSLANLGGYPSTGGVLVNDNAVITLKAKTANNGVWLLMQESDGSNLCYLGKGSNGNNDAVFNNYKGGNNSIILRANGSVDLTAQQSQPINLNSEPRTTSPNAWRIIYGDYGAFWRQDGGSLYLMLTNKGDPRGSYNALRPLRVDMSTGAVTIGTPLGVADTIYASKEITAGYSGVFSWDKQYATKAPFFNSYATTGASEYHPVFKQLATITGKNSYAFSMGTLVGGTALTWHLHMRGSSGANVDYSWDTNGNFTAPGELVPGSFANFDARYYTQTVANGKFQPKGNYTPAGEAYTKAQSDSKYPTAFRVGSRVTYNGYDFGGKVPQGAVNINNYTNDDDRINGVVYAYLQFYLNGKWVNFS
ncbi:phage tail protein [Enterobacter cancerogenus]|uniref:phage tail protein n=1 Tax=Enterobacter cancerogenus TaxID=69218 RepID=UPI00382D021E